MSVPAERRRKPASTHAVSCIKLYLRKFQTKDKIVLSLNDVILPKICWKPYDVYLKAFKQKMKEKKIKKYKD